MDEKFVKAMENIIKGMAPLIDMIQHNSMIMQVQDQMNFRMLCDLHDKFSFRIHEEMLREFNYKIGHTDTTLYSNEEIWTKFQEIFEEIFLEFLGDNPELILEVNKLKGLLPNASDKEN